MKICILPMTYDEWTNTFAKLSNKDLGLKALYDEDIKTADDIDDASLYEVIDEHVFFLAVVKHGIRFEIVND